MLKLFMLVVLFYLSLPSNNIKASDCEMKDGNINIDASLSFDQIQQAIVDAIANHKLPHNHTNINHDTQVSVNLVGQGFHQMLSYHFSSSNLFNYLINY